MNAQPFRPYLPPTHQERHGFEAAWCAGCRHNQAEGQAGVECDEQLLVDDLWRYNQHGIPFCTRFESRDGPPALSVAVRDERTGDMFGGGA